MSPAKTPTKSVTPGSVKALMIIEACFIGFLAYWLYSEYTYNLNFRTYVDAMFVQHLTSYTIALGLGIGLAGSAVAATLYRNLKHAKYRLETLAGPKIKGAMERVLSSMPTLDEHQTTNVVKDSTPVPSSTPALTSPPPPLAAPDTAAIVPVPPVNEKK